MNSISRICSLHVATSEKYKWLLLGADSEKKQMINACIVTMHCTMTAFTMCGGLAFYPCGLPILLVVNHSLETSQTDD